MNREVRLGITVRGKLILGIAALIFITNIIQPWRPAGINSIYITFIILTILISGWIVNRSRAYVLERLTIKRDVSTPIYEDEETTIRIIIENTAAVGIYNAIFQDHYPETMHKVEGENIGNIQIPPKSTIEITYKLRARGIGRNQFGTMVIRLLDPLGLYYMEGIYSDVELSSIEVMPIIPQASVEEYLARGIKLELGPRIARQSGISTEFRDIREYVPGDETRRIDWKATAKLNKLMIREYELEKRNNIVLILDLSRNMFIGELGVRKIDYAARTIAYIINYASTKKDNIGLVIFGSDKVDLIPVSMASDALVKRALEKLSRIPVYPPKPRKEESDIIDPGTVIGRLGLRDKTLFIFLSDLEDGETIERVTNMAQILRALRHEVVVVSPLTVLFEARLLKGIESAIYKVVGYTSLRRRKESVEELVKIGVPVINVGPNDLIPYLLMKIEQYRRMIVI